MHQGQGRGFAGDGIAGFIRDDDAVLTAVTRSGRRNGDALLRGAVVLPAAARILVLPDVAQGAGADRLDAEGHLGAVEHGNALRLADDLNRNDGQGRSCAGGGVAGFIRDDNTVLAAVTCGGCRNGDALIRGAVFLPAAAWILVLPDVAQRTGADRFDAEGHLGAVKHRSALGLARDGDGTRGHHVVFLDREEFGGLFARDELDQREQMILKAAGRQILVQLLDQFFGLRRVKHGHLAKLHVGDEILFIGLLGRVSIKSDFQPAVGFILGAVADDGVNHGFFSEKAELILSVRGFEHERSGRKPDVALFEDCDFLFDERIRILDEDDLVFFGLNGDQILADLILENKILIRHGDILRSRTGRGEDVEQHQNCQHQTQDMFLLHYILLTFCAAFPSVEHPDRSAF